MKIETTKLQELVSKATKGVSNNKLIPITSLIGIRVKDGNIILETTDATNYLYVKDVIDSNYFDVVVDADVFSKLVSRMTSEFITLNILDNVLEVTGDGKYKIELPLDENGQHIKYPDPLSEFGDFENAQTVDLAVIKSMLSSLKPSLATTLEDPQYTAYYVGDTVLATDTLQIAELKKTIFKTPVLLTREYVDLLDVFNSEKISVLIKGDSVVFSDDKNCVFGKLFGGIEDFNVAGIASVLDISMPSMCKFSKTALLNVLNRLALFVRPYDKNGISLVFTPNGLQISSKSDSSVELIPYKESNNYKEYSCMIDIEMLLTQIKTNSTDVIEINYGNDSCITLTDGDIRHVIALLME